MKILFVHNFYQQRGGEETYFFALEKLLRERGHQVATYTKDSRDIKTGLSNNLRLAYGIFRNEHVREELEEIMQNNRPDLVHCHNIYPLVTPLVYRVCAKHHVPVVQTVHNYKLVCPGGLMFKDGKKCIHNNRYVPNILKLLSNCYRNSYFQTFIFALSLIFHRLNHNFDHINRYLFPTNFARQIHQKHLNLPKNKCKVLPYFAVKPKKLPSSVDKNYFLFVGRFSAEKGILQLLQLFSTLPKLKLVVIGSGPLSDDVFRFKIYKNIRVVKFSNMKTVYKYMSSALATIVPSRWYEVLPNVIIESFAVGTFVIAPKIGEFNYLLSTSKAGTLFNLNDYNDLRLKILKTWDDRDKIIKKQSEIRQYYNDHYSPAKHYQQIMKIYKQLLTEK